MTRQIAVFAVAFAILQVGFELFRGAPLTVDVLTQIAFWTIVATGLYAGVIVLIKKRRNDGE